MAELACEWLHHPVPLGPGVNTTWYNTWRGHIFKEKRKLYIGGIFPMSGTKYVAPELAIGMNNICPLICHLENITIGKVREGIENMELIDSQLNSKELIH